MDTTNGTRRASGARGRARGRGAAGVHPGQMSCAAGLPCLDGDAATAVRQFAEIAFASGDLVRAGTSETCPAPPDAWDVAVPYEHYVPVFYTHDGSEYRVASPGQMLQHVQYLVGRRFYRHGALIDQPHVVRAILELELAAHPRIIFAALFLDRQLHLIDFVELFTGTTDRITVYPREVVREALRRNAEAVVCARNDPTGDNSTVAPHDTATALRLRHALLQVDIRLIDYLVVGKRISSLAERGVV